MPKGRPPISRRVGFLPQVTYFKPAGIPMTMLKEASLSVEEAETIRLKDLEGLEQGKCAAKMNISRTTFQRLLGSARQKIAQALLTGMAIRIGGGNFEMAAYRFRCLEGHEWEVPPEVIAESNPGSCPTCNTSNISAVYPEVKGRWRKGTGKNRQGRWGKE